MSDADTLPPAQGAILRELERADSPLTRSALGDRLTQARSTTVRALRTLREDDRVERIPNYPSPKYQLAPSLYENDSHDGS
jgi:DNA-binding MarR family transcriptional regulator